MNDQKEAWEHIAGELPAWVRIVEVSVPMEDDQWCIEAGDILCGPFGDEAEAERHAWAILGGRRKHAELIAPQRVREAARIARKYTNCTLEHRDFIAAESVHHEFRIVDVDSYEETFIVESWEGPDICTAAWAAIQEMKA